MRVAIVAYNISRVISTVSYVYTRTTLSSISRDIEVTV